MELELIQQKVQNACGILSTEATSAESKLSALKAQVRGGIHITSEQIEAVEHNVNSAFKSVSDILGPIAQELTKEHSIPKPSGVQINPGQTQTQPDIKHVDPGQKSSLTEHPGTQGPTGNNPFKK